MEQREWTEEARRFARVWKRVMPEQREFCPIEPAALSAGEASPAGEGEEGERGFLRRRIAAELECWQACRALARRGDGRMAEAAARALTRARQLSAAYARRTGIRYLPLEQAARWGARSPWGPEEQCRREREAAEDYRRAAERAEGELKELFARLARERAGQARRLEGRRH